MPSSTRIRPVGPSRAIIDRAMRATEQAFRVVMADNQIPADMVETVLAAALQLSRQELQQTIWDAYKEGVERGAEGL